MRAAVSLLNLLLPLLYGAATVAYAVDFFRDLAPAARRARRLLGVTIALHALYLGLRTVLYEHIPLASSFEVLTTVALALAVVYLWVERRTGVVKTGMFIVAFCFTFQAVSSAFLTNPLRFPEVLRSPLFGLHTMAAVLGDTAFAVSAVYGVLFLLLHHELKASRFGIVYQRLPPLDVLARLSLRAAVLGLAFLTLTIAIGAVWAAQQFPGFHGDPKFLLILLVWLVYGAALGLNYRWGWNGRRAIYVSLLGFALMLAQAAIARLWLRSFHGFA
ncbi:MAG TPA: cytochrome c biogenesis protein CcsA [Vicinamibacteria bacterium]|jgi:ABC-type uncharacterized transport system permease subunit